MSTIPVIVYMSGRLHRSEEWFILSFSPLWTGFFFLDFILVLFHVGEITQESVFMYSRSPLSKIKTCEFSHILCHPILVHFWWFAIYQGHGWGDNIAYGVRTPYMYIYSLRHFLTTKGALIDGDGYPPLPPLKWVKKGVKIERNLTKIETKKHSKTAILNGKIDFFIKIE